MNLIKNFIIHQECPGVNGIYYPDETAQLLDVNAPNDSTSGMYVIGKGKKVPISYLKKNGIIDYWNDCAYICRRELPEHNIVLMAGESDYGSDGFVAAFKKKHNKLIWLAFLDCSNPFSDALIDDALNVNAHSTNGFLWTFPLSSPENITVKRLLF